MLGALSPPQFLAEYWQRKPLLIRGALPDFAPPIDGDELAGLACEALAESRLVLGPDENGHWALEHGPFEESRFGELPESHFSLLVQDVDKWDLDTATLLDRFDFLPTWRTDDVMISFAAPGGSVGPHVDHYDVFLLQAQGRRHWQIDQRANPPLEFVADQPLKLLQAFEPTDEWTLEPGDMLYLPPGVPHHGVAVDACLTYSIGMRAPSVGELITDYIESVAEQSADSRRFSDPGRAPAKAKGLLSIEDIEQTRQLIKQTINPDNDVGEWFASYLSRYRQTHAIAQPDQTINDNQLHNLARHGGTIQRNPWARFCFVERPDQRAILFASGERFDTSLAAAKWVCANRISSGGRLSSALADKGLNELLLALLNGGYWRPIADD